MSLFIPLRKSVNINEEGAMESQKDMKYNDVRVNNESKSMNNVRKIADK